MKECVRKRTKSQFIAFHAPEIKGQDFVIIITVCVVLLQLRCRARSRSLRIQRRSKSRKRRRFIQRQSGHRRRLLLLRQSALLNLLQWDSCVCSLQRSSCRIWWLHPARWRSRWSLHDRPSKFADVSFVSTVATSTVVVDLFKGLLPHAPFLVRGAWQLLRPIARFFCLVFSLYFVMGW